MYTLPASEVKRRGIVALEEHLDEGPIHIIKNNRPVCVVLSEKDYAELANRAQASTSTSNSLWDLVDNRPWTGKRSKKDINVQIKKERSDWEK